MLWPPRNFGVYNWSSITPRHFDSLVLCPSVHGFSATQTQFVYRPVIISWTVAIFSRRLVIPDPLIAGPADFELVLLMHMVKN